MQVARGPIADLEAALPDNWWRTLFGPMYLKTDGDVVENPANTAAEVDALVRISGLDPGARLLDLCCGHGRHLLELAARGHLNLLGVDQSAHLLEVARERALGLGLTLPLLRADSRRLPLADRQFDCVALLGNSFGYTSDPADDLRVLAEAHRLLVPGGSLVLDLSDGEWVRRNHAPRSWEWLDNLHLALRERQLARDGERLVCREIVVHRRRGVIADQFYAERLYSRARLAELLDRAGFDAVTDHEAGETASSNGGQDLGLLAARMLVSARRPRGPRRASVAARLSVAVLLGDPRLADETKADGRFGAADLDVVARMKAALDVLPGYRWHYLDAHDRLIQDLAALRPDLALNLCDEGLHNDPRREATVPALLDALAVPYSGAAPDCLHLCHDKARSRVLARDLGVPVPAEVPLTPGAPLPRGLPYPVLVKPRLGDGSFGIDADSLVADRGALARLLARREERHPGRAWLAQEWLPGREFSVGVLAGADGSPELLPVLEVDYSRLPRGVPPIQDFGYKSASALPIGEKPARLGARERRWLADWSLLLFRELGCRDYARFDYRCGADCVPRFLEANPNPGWCWDGKMAVMAAWAGLGYGEFLGRIVAAAARRVR